MGSRRWSRGVWSTRLQSRLSGWTQTRRTFLPFPAAISHRWKVHKLPKTMAPPPHLEIYRFLSKDTKSRNERKEGSRMVATNWGVMWPEKLIKEKKLIVFEWMLMEKQSSNWTSTPGSFSSSLREEWSQPAPQQPQNKTNIIVETWNRTPAQSVQHVQSSYSSILLFGLQRKRPLSLLSEFPFTRCQSAAISSQLSGFCCSDDEIRACHMALSPTALGPHRTFRIMCMTSIANPQWKLHVEQQKQSDVGHNRNHLHTDRETAAWDTFLAITECSVYLQRWHL